MTTLKDYPGIGLFQFSTQKIPWKLSKAFIEGRPKYPPKRRD